jgi:TRAP-type transport system periplasmic protein
MKLIPHRNCVKVVLYIIITLLMSSNTLAKTTIRFATLAPKNSPWMQIMQELNVELKERSNNELKFKFYPNMSMGSETDVIRKIQLGQIQAAGFTGYGLGSVLPEMRILELPYLFRDVEELDFVVSELTDDFNIKLNEKGFVLLGWADVGWVYFFSANKPIVELHTLAEQKMWMWEGDPLAEAFYSELDKSPVSLPITDVHLSLQTGLINTVYCSPIAALALQWFTKLKFVNSRPFTYAIGAVLIEKKTFDDLDPELQDLLLELSKKHLRNLQVLTRENSVEAYQQLMKEGIHAAISDSTQQKQFMDIGNNVHNKLADEMYPKKLLNRLQLSIDKYRSSSTSDKK